MKATVFLILISFALGCNQQQDSGSDISAKTARKFDFRKADPNSESFAAYNLRKSTIDLKLQKVKIDIPSGKISKADLISADEEYKDFLKENSDKELTTAFKNKYAAIMLVNYGLINSSDYKNIEFYTNELITSGMKDASLVIKGINKLNDVKGEINVEKTKTLAFKYLKEKIDLDIKKLAIIREHTLKPNKKSQGTLRQDFLEALDKQVLADIEEKLKADQLYLEQIAQL
jgi:hypothetical protein